QLTAEHASIVYEISRWEVIGAIDDDVEVAEDSHGVVAAEASIKSANLDKWVHRFDLVSGRVKLRASYIGGGVNDLALQVREVDDIEVDKTERAHARGGEIQRERRAHASGANAEHTGGRQLL